MSARAKERAPFTKPGRWFFVVFLSSAACIPSVEVPLPEETYALAFLLEVRGQHAYVEEATLVDLQEGQFLDSPSPVGFGVTNSDTLLLLGMTAEQVNRAAPDFDASRWSEARLILAGEGAALLERGHRRRVPFTGAVQRWSVGMPAFVAATEEEVSLARTFDLLLPADPDRCVVTAPLERFDRQATIRDQVPIFGWPRAGSDLFYFALHTLRRVTSDIIVAASYNVLYQFQRGRDYTDDPAYVINPKASLPPLDTWIVMDLDVQYVADRFLAVLSIGVWEGPSAGALIVYEVKPSGMRLLRTSTYSESLRGIALGLDGHMIAHGDSFVVTATSPLGRYQKWDLSAMGSPTAVAVTPFESMRYLVGTDFGLVAAGPDPSRFEFLSNSTTFRERVGSFAWREVDGELEIWSGHKEGILVRWLHGIPVEIPVRVLSKHWRCLWADYPSGVEAITANIESLALWQVNEDLALFMTVQDCSGMIRLDTATQCTTLLHRAGSPIHSSPTLEDLHLQHGYVTMAGSEGGLFELELER